MRAAGCRSPAATSTAAAACPPCTARTCTPIGAPRSSGLARRRRGPPWSSRTPRWSSPSARRTTASCTWLPSPESCTGCRSSAARRERGGEVVDRLVTLGEHERRRRRRPRRPRRCGVLEVDGVVVDAEEAHRRDDRRRSSAVETAQDLVAHILLDALAGHVAVDRERDPAARRAASSASPRPIQSQRQSATTTWPRGNRRRAAPARRRGRRRPWRPRGRPSRPRAGGDDDDVRRLSAHEVRVDADAGHEADAGARRPRARLV